MAEIIAEFENMNSTKNATTTEPAPAAETTPDKENAEPQKLSKSQKKRLKEKEKKGKIALRDRPCFADGKFPLGQICEYPERPDEIMRVWNATQAEREARDEADFYRWNDWRQGGEVHRISRKMTNEWMKPGMKMFDIVERIDAQNRALIGLQRDETTGKPTSGLGFPVGCSLNECAAHYTPNAGDNTVLKYDDVCKIDFGIQVNGRIVDSAFTKIFNPKYQPLLDASLDATNTGIKNAGIDVNLGELGEIIQETMESHEITLDGITRQINSVTNLTGHSIEAYQIHAGKQVPNCHAPEYNEKMEEGEVFAIETFASTGGGYVDHDPDCSHYMIKFNQLDQIPKNISTKGRKLAHVIKNEFSSLPFCRRWIDRLDYAKGETWEGKYLMQLNELVKSRWIRDYPGLSDTQGSFVAQFEHTVLMRPTCKEVVTRGDDY